MKLNAIKCTAQDRTRLIQGLGLPRFFLWSRYKIGFSIATNSRLCLRSNDASRDVWRLVCFECETVIQKEIYCPVLTLWATAVITGTI